MSKKLKTYNNAWVAIYEELKKVIDHTNSHFGRVNTLPAVETLGPYSSVNLTVKTNADYPLEMHSDQIDRTYTATVLFSLQKDSEPTGKGFRLEVTGSAMLRGGSLWGELTNCKRQLSASSRFEFGTKWYDKDDALAQAIAAIDKVDFVKTIEEMLNQLHKDMILVS